MMSSHDKPLPPTCLWKSRLHIYAEETCPMSFAGRHGLQLHLPCTETSTSAPAVPASLVAWQAKRPEWFSSTWLMCSRVPCEASCTPTSSSAGRPFCNHLRWTERGWDHHEASPPWLNNHAHTPRSRLTLPSPQPTFCLSPPWPVRYILDGGHRGA